VQSRRRLGAIRRLTTPSLTPKPSRHLPRSSPSLEDRSQAVSYGWETIEGTLMAKARFHGHRVLLFINNPTSSGFIDPTGMGGSYDVMTAPDTSSYSVPVNAVSVEDGDIAVVYRADYTAVRRDPGRIVAVARITSSPWRSRWDTEVNWGLLRLPPEAWISSADMHSSGLWTNKVPLSGNPQASSPVQLGADQWKWIAQQLPDAAVDWLASHARAG
jgi:hypothetical protein